MNPSINSYFPNIRRKKKTKPKPKQKPRQNQTKTKPKPKTQQKNTNVVPQTKVVKKANTTATGGYGYNWKANSQATPKNRGQNAIPVGEMSCLTGIKFVLTGVLDSLDRDEAKDLILEYGGSVVGAPSGRVNYIVAGEAAGPSKLKKAANLGIKVIDEKGLFDLIRTSKTPVHIKKQQENIKKKAQTVKPRTVHNVGTEVWTEKYRPKKSTQIAGNKKVQKELRQWLENWKKKPFQMSPKAVLLSGQPGIGKTTMALVLSRELGFVPIEFNASDFRSKKLLQNLVSEMTSTNIITNYFKVKQTKNKKIKQMQDAKSPVMIMDEVDGMSSGDRGGMSELVKIIKTTKIPIICICNDRNSQKIRRLSNICLDLKFRKLTVTQGINLLSKICQNEGYTHIGQNALNKLLQETNCDIRRAINMLQTWRISSSALLFQDVKTQMKGIQSKPIITTPFDLSRKFFSFRKENSNIGMRFQTFFQDYQILPLFVFENYLNAKPMNFEITDKNYDMQNHRNAISSISDSDIITPHIMKHRAWHLLSSFGYLSSIYPGAMLDGGVNGFMQFPKLLGLMSSTRKRNRLVSELSKKTYIHTHSSNKRSFVLDRLPLFRKKLSKPLIERGQDGIKQVVDFMDTYELDRMDWDSIMEITQIIDLKKKFNDPDLIPEINLYDIKGPLKTRFTRYYNLNHQTQSIKKRKGKGKKGKKKNSLRGKNDDMDGIPVSVSEKEASILEIDSEDENDDDDDDIEEDLLILSKKENRKRKDVIEKDTFKKVINKNGMNHEKKNKKKRRYQKKN
ncbi:replication factor c subunit [Anaeramoeba flamelloides]|uniref:Replication factor C subunit 1 n=1 Tax=Anaeramoeba flamelloides TaxID=1746091 RepID=A0AAV7ZRK6_9EUKA|nr:replication factor c subunit [Anaeramoeba flamelloides]